MSYNIEVKVIGHVGEGVPTIASEIAQALRLLGFKVTIGGKLKKEVPQGSLSQTKRVKAMVSSIENHIKIICEQLPRKV